MRSVQRGAAVEGALEPEDLEAMRHASLFAALLPEEFVCLTGHARLRLLKNQAQIFAEGEPAEAFYFLAAGTVRLYRLSPSGDEKVIEILGPGQAFAEAVVFLGGRYPVSASALSDVRLVEIPTHDFMRTLEASPSMALRMLAGVSHRLHQLINDVHALALETAGQRVAGYLLEQCSEGINSGDVHIEVHKNVIASRLGVKPETFSRTLAALRGLGLIAVDGQHIHIADRQALLTWRAAAKA